MTVSSGMAALDIILRLLKPGDEIIAGDDIYGGTHRLLTYIRTHVGVIVHHVDTTDPANFDALIRPGKTAMVLLESPTNPLLKICDIATISAKVKEKAPDAIMVVDNTMMSPYLQRPLEHGADIAYDSATKYLSGHHDLMAGVITCNRDDLAKVRSALDYNGVKNKFFTTRFSEHGTCDQLRRKCANTLRFIPTPPWDEDIGYSHGSPTIYGHEGCQYA